MNSLLETVRKVMCIFNEEYPGKFAVTPAREAIWLKLLDGFDVDLIFAAALQLVSTRPDWPPDVATLRNLVVTYAGGELEEPSALVAWEHVHEVINGGDHKKLTALELRALKMTGSTYDLARSEMPGADRAHFLKVFAELLLERRSARGTLPEVKNLVERQKERLLKNGK
ncbi:replicative helicase loader/inhibitor [Candidatus Magnetobacterium casense]|uniref:Replicative helicase inhibitor G39P N-terminal domain-containing protein n=1 Tax=Candidatus Magnetobacterium casense TaxID=1455061 RepID=A0ABS6RY67_9BACT|nr:replicative helicase loader/inhibitor [Candidatus Magnetobacterium casensis]MBV6340974.1 hypothetical protein [Candidatus Magnetobacterium casensis]